MTVVDRPAARNNDLAAIHIAKAALGLSEDEYRDIIATVCQGVRSAAALDHANRKRLRDHLQARVREQRRPANRHSGPLLTPAQRKLWSLWMELADEALVRTRTAQALSAWAARHTGVSHFRLLNEPQLHMCIESLKLWLRRREEPNPNG